VESRRKDWSFGVDGSNCPACGDAGIEPQFWSTDLLYQTTEERFLIAGCRSCGLLRLTPPITPAQLAKFYPSKYWFVADVLSSLEDHYRRFVLRDHVRFVLSAYRRSGKHGFLLDVGCGGGLLLAMIRPHGAPILGLDFSTEAASIAWHSHAVPVICGTLDHVPLPEKSCAVVTMFHVVEHLANPVAHLAAAHALLSPGGRLIVQVPNADCWQFRIFGKRWNGIDVPRHLIDYRTADLVNLLEVCGFRVQRTKHFSLRDNPAGFATSLARGLDPMVRRLTKPAEPAPIRLIKNLAYLAIVIAAVPLTLVEALFRRGSTVMIEAALADERPLT